MTELNKNHAKFLIIGAGPIGLYTAFRFGLKNISTTIIEATNSVGGQCSALYPDKYLYDIPGIPEIKVSDFINNLYTQFKSYQHNLILGTTVKNIKNVGNMFEIETNQETYTAEYIILATGGGAFTPIKPSIENIDNFPSQIFYSVKSKELMRNKNIVIFGGGDSAVDWACNLYEIASKVTLIHRKDKFRALESSILKLEDLKSKNKIAIYTNANLKKIEGKDGKINNILISMQDNNLISLKPDCVLIFFGMKMEDTISKFDIGIATERGKVQILQNSANSSVQNIYSIGDASIFENKKFNLTNGFGQAVQLVEELSKKNL